MSSDPRGALPSDAQLDDLLRQPVVCWPAASAVAVRERVESSARLGAAVLAVVVDAASPGRGALDGQVREVLWEAVRDTYPAWLPEAEGPGGAGLDAVRAICKRAAGQSDLFRPFLVAAAEAALCRRAVDASEFTPETAMREARKLVLRACGAQRLVVIVELTGAWSTPQVERAQASARWLAGPGGLTVWLFGAPTAGMELFHRFRAAAGPPPTDPPVAPRGRYLTPPVGRPNAFSRAERDLEEHLAKCPWAAGRAWNQTWSQGALANPIRVDLLWAREKCAVELDGPDHLNPDKYEADRKRDRALQCAGFAVLRYTNEEVRDDVARVADELRRFVDDRRRSAAGEG